MNKKTTLITLLIVILIGVIGVSAYLLKGLGKQGEKVPVQTQPAVSTQHELDTSGWKTYRNEEYGFEIRYPRDFIAETDISLATMEGGIIKFRLMDNKYYQGTNLQEASAVIGARKNKEDLANCLEPEPLSLYSKELPEEVINNIIFKRDLVTEGAAGHWYEKVSYRTLYKDSCYAIVLFTHSTNIGVYTPGTVSEFEKDEILKKLKEVFATFRFIK